MMFLAVLCLAVGALANPALYVPRASLEYPWTFPLRSVAIMDAEAKLAGIPGAPTLEPLSLVKAFEIEALPSEPGKEKEEGEKTEEKKEEMEGEMEGEKEIEKEKDEEKPLDPKKPILVKWDIQKLPEYLTNFWTNLPTYFPHITFPPIFTKPGVAPVPVAATPEEIAKYRLLYDYPFVAPTHVRVIEKK